MKININVPTSLSDIKLSQYQKFIRTTKDSEDDNFIARQMVCIFCDLPDSVVGSIKANQYDDLVKDISEVLQQKGTFKSTFKMNSVEYGFIPNLDDITVDEKADLDTFYKDVQTLDKAMGVLYRPITVKTKRGYLIEDYTDEYLGQSLDVTLDIVFGANVFFSNLTKDLLNYIQRFTVEQVERNPKALQILAQNGVGITAFTNSLEEMFYDLNKLVNLNYTQH